MALNDWVITGANGNLGKRLIDELTRETDSRVRAIVRSQSAADTLKNLPLTSDQRSRLDIRICDYRDTDGLSEAFQGYSNLVHLVGILKQTRYASYEDAHELSCEAIAAASLKSTLSHIVYLSIVGSRSDSRNLCLASKGRAEQILRQGPTDSCVLRVPMVLGEHDYASKALFYRAIKPVSFTFRSSSLEQPIYAGDVLKAIRSVVFNKVVGSFDLGGPQSLSRKALLQKSSELLGKSTRVVSVPISVGLLLGKVFELIMANPPVTAAMMGVLDHDDSIDTKDVMTQIGLEKLTSLDSMLGLVFEVIEDASINTEG